MWLDDVQLGNSAEFYLDHGRSEEILSHRQILGEFGADASLADDMLSDQGTILIRNSLIKINCK